MSHGRILVVDDSRDMANGIAMLLEEIGFEVQVAHSGKRAMAMLTDQGFELVLSDVRMPTMSGVELLERIRARWPLTKVVLLTAFGTIDAAVHAMRCGACDYLTKPFDNDELLRVVKRALAEGLPAGGADDSAVVGEMSAALASEDLLDGLKRALAVLVRSTGADDGEIFLREPEGGDSLLCVWDGPDGDALLERTRFEPGIGLAGIVAATGESVCIRGGLATDRRCVRPAVAAAGLKSFAAAPLPDARGVLGSIHLLSRSEGFLTEGVLDLLKRAAVPLASAIRAALADLRQSVDVVCERLHEPSVQARELLETMRRVAGARSGTLALIDPSQGRPHRVVSTGPTALVCMHVEAGNGKNCASLMEAHGLVAIPGRRSWPEACRGGLPRRAASPCCLPLLAGARLYGLIVLDFGREGPQEANGRLVQLLCMARQFAMRLESYHAGQGLDSQDKARGLADGVQTERPELELRCLGPFQVLRRGQLIPAETFTRSHALVLLKLLAMREGAPVNRDVLIEQLWPEVDPRHGANRLHVVVHDLRSVIEVQRNTREWMYLRNRGDLYYLDVSASIEIDLIRFKDLLIRAHEAVAQQAPEACALLEQAVGLYRGDLFADDSFASWCEKERQEMRESYDAALESLAKLYQDQGCFEKELDCRRRALRSSPLREDLLVAYAELLAELARPQEALAAYEEYQKKLRDELGVGPSSALRDVHRRLLSAVRGYDGRSQPLRV